MDERALTVTVLIGILLGTAYLATRGKGSNCGVCAKMRRKFGVSPKAVETLLYAPNDAMWSHVPYYLRYNTPSDMIHRHHALPITSEVFDRAGGTNGYAGRAQQL
jgi:hypothetical protein